jgi:hypothetical protein
MRRGTGEAVANGVAQHLVEHDMDRVGIRVCEPVVDLELVHELHGPANFLQLAVDDQAHHVANRERGCLDTAMIDGHSAAVL